MSVLTGSNLGGKRDEAKDTRDSGVKRKRVLTLGMSWCSLRASSLLLNSLTRSLWVLVATLEIFFSSCRGVSAKLQKEKRMHISRRYSSPFLAERLQIFSRLLFYLQQPSGPLVPLIWMCHLHQLLLNQFLANETGQYRPCLSLSI